MSKLKVRKRDGSIQDFDINKIRKVVKDAFNTTKETVDESKLNKLLDTIGLKNYDENYIIDIETIQDSVEYILMQLGCYKTAKELLGKHYFRDDVPDEFLNLIMDYGFRAL